MAIPKPQMSLYFKEEALMLEDLFKFHFALPKKKAPKKAKTLLFLSLITIVVKVLECMNEDEAEKASVCVD